MLVGHIAAAMVGKRVEPKLSFGTLVLAALLADVLWCVFMLAGIEHVQIRSGLGAANYIEVFEVPFSHSLLMDAIWAALFAGIYFWRRRYIRGAVVLFAMVLGHWLLDFVAHKDAMPIAPGLRSHVGLGLWSSVPATIIVEGGLWLLAVIIYLRATRSNGRAGVVVFWIVFLLLTLAWFNNIAGPPPPNPSTMGISSLVFFALIVVWAYWMNRLRAARGSD